MGHQLSMADVRRALVKKTSEKLIGSHDADELVSDREMVALGIGMNCADLIMRGKLEITDVDSMTAEVMRRFRVSLIYMRTLGLDI